MEMEMENRNVIKMILVKASFSILKNCITLYTSTCVRI